MTTATTAAPTFKLNDYSLEMYIDGTYAGYLKLLNEGSGTYRVDKVEIEGEFRGMGLYRQMLVAAFSNFTKLDIIRSYERNYNSNPIYCAWVGEEIEEDQVVWVQCFGGNLEFTVDEE